MVARGKEEDASDLWSLADSYRLVLLGEAARHGTLWSA